jgi:acyl-CoA thioesterase-2
MFGPARARTIRRMAVEFRPVVPRNPLGPVVLPPQQAFWVRAQGPLPADPLLHDCVLAYASDLNLLSTALLPHGRSWLSQDLAVASIDHALWFHRPLRIDDWLLYAMDSPTAQGGRGFSRGQFFDRQGRLVASVAQENLMRYATRPG